MKILLLNSTTGVRIFTQGLNNVEKRRSNVAVAFLFLLHIQEVPDSSFGVVVTLKEAFNKKKVPFTRKLDLNLRKKLRKRSIVWC
jgi:hypothetical protein